MKISESLSGFLSVAFAIYYYVMCDITYILSLQYFTICYYSNYILIEIWNNLTLYDLKYIFIPLISDSNIFF